MVAFSHYDNLGGDWISVEQMQIKSLNECTLDEINELWYVGFQQYFRDMTRVVEQTVNHLGACSIKPNLSVAAYIDGMPAGFVLIGLKNVHDVKTAWNGGTGDNPLFRGRGMPRSCYRKPLRECVKQMWIGLHLR